MLFPTLPALAQPAVIAAAVPALSLLGEMVSIVPSMLPLYPPALVALGILF